jgi:hypothetical protein
MDKKKNPIVMVDGIRDLLSFPAPSCGGKKRDRANHSRPLVDSILNSSAMAQHCNVTMMFSTYFTCVQEVLGV